ncbi:MAG: hypothetical protein KDA70_12665, partial [Planctomycetaceae bacterium]|nr:hypothetical protein [Planctomycetaceae bacterium]
MYSASTTGFQQAEAFSQLGERAIVADQSKSCQCELLAAKKAVRMRKVCVTRELQKRAEQICATEIEYVYSERFVDAAAIDDILQPLQKLCAELNPDSDYELTEFDFQQAQLYTVPLLDKEQEVILFRGMNYLKYRAELLKSQV